MTERSVGTRVTASMTTMPSRIAPRTHAVDGTAGSGGLVRARAAWAGRSLPRLAAARRPAWIPAVAARPPPARTATGPSGPLAVVVTRSETGAAGCGSASGLATSGGPARLSPRTLDASKRGKAPAPA